MIADRRVFVVILSALCLIGGIAQAQPATAEQIRAGLLAGRLDDSPRLPGAQKTRQLQVIHRVGLTVSFKPGSSVLAAEGELQLDELARALQSPELASRAYLIAGHTDRHGNPRKNLRLSEQRAAVVRDYLLTHFDLDASRLKVAGFGDTQPLPGTSPFNAANRRVEITEVGRAASASAPGRASAAIEADPSAPLAAESPAEPPAAR